VPTPANVLAAFEAAIDAMTAAGATIVDLDKEGFTFASADGEFLVLLFRLPQRRGGLFRHSQGRAGRRRDAADAIDFNNAHAAEEMPFFNQDISSWRSRSRPVPTIRSRSSGNDLQPGAGHRPERRSATASTRR